MEINADLGAEKQVNIIVVVAATDEREYFNALESAWLGGKKNDFVLVVGAPDFPEIAWAKVMTWMKVEGDGESAGLREDVAMAVERMKKFNAKKIAKLLRTEVQAKFVRRPMSDFEYLTKEMEPPFWALIMLLCLGLAASVTLSIVFWRYDV
jgi:hypothetical protein